MSGISNMSSHAEWRYSRRPAPSTHCTRARPNFEVNRTAKPGTALKSTKQARHKQLPAKTSTAAPAPISARRTIFHEHLNMNIFARTEISFRPINRITSAQGYPGNLIKDPRQLVQRRRNIDVSASHTSDVLLRATKSTGTIGGCAHAEKRVGRASSIPRRSPSTRARAHWHRGASHRLRKTQKLRRNARH